MGSAFAGMKAGVLAGLVYFGGTALFNIFVIYLFESDALSYIRTNFASSCSTLPASGLPSPADCLYAFVVVDVALLTFVAYFASLGLSLLFGRSYESLPGSTPRRKGLIVGFAMLVIFVLLGAWSLIFNYASFVMLASFTIAVTAVYGILLGNLYRRYTREVQITSQNANALRIMVDGKDLTGKTLTFAAKSSHKLKASLTEGSSFREWAVSGGVTVEDSRSFDTLMEVTGDGMLKGQVSPKY